MSNPFAATDRLAGRLNRLARTMVPGGLGGRTDLASPKVALAGMVPAVTPGEALVSGGPLVALFLNNASPFLSSGYHHYDFADSSVTDPSWFEWPVGGSDQTRVRLLESGIYSMCATSIGTGGSTHRVLIECGIFGTLGGNYDGSSGTSVVSTSGGVAVYPSAIDPSGTDVDVRVSAAGTTDAQGMLVIVRWPSPYFESSSGSGFVWEEVTY